MSILVSTVKPTETRRTTLGEILTLVNGRAYKQEELLESGIPVIRIQNLNGGQRFYYSNLSLPDKNYCENGDLLFAWSATFGPYFWTGPKAIFHYHIWKVLPSKLLDKRFAYYLLQAITERVKAAGRGISMIHMTKSGMEAWEVDLPPLDEQKRIAAILDKADQLRKKRRQVIALLDSLTQSIFLEMFGDPLSNPKMWPIDHLGRLCDVRDGTHDSPKYISDGFPLLTSKNFSSGSVNLLGAKMISKSDFNQINKRSKVDIGDIVMPMIGTIGSPVIIDTEPNFAIKNVALIKFNERSPTVEYIYALLSSRYLDHALSKVAKGGTQKFLSLGELRNLPVPVPPKDKQFKFTQFLTTLKNRKRFSEMSDLNLAYLFSSLQYRAFSGQL